MAGPLEMTLGRPIATLFTLALAASMAELCSAYPTAGAMYDWASALGGAGCGWFVACLNIVGLVAAQAGINFSCAQFILPFPGIPASTRNVYFMFAFTLAAHGLTNYFGVRLVAILNDISVAIHVIGAAVMPPNLLAAKTLAGTVAGLLMIYFAQVRRNFRGPAWTRDSGASAVAEDRS